MSTAMHELTIRLDDLGDIARVELPDPRSEETVRDLLRRAGAASVRIEPFQEDDTAGHALADSLEVVVRIEDDTEGHAMSLRFPTTGEARDFQRRLLATGAIAATIVAGAAAVQMTGQGAAEQAGAPAAGPAIVRPAPAMAPGLAAEEKGGDLAAPTVTAPTFDRGAAVHNAGKSTTMPDGWQTSRRHFPQEAAPAAPSVAPGMAAEIKGGDAAEPAEESAAEDATPNQQDGSFFRGR